MCLIFLKRKEFKNTQTYRFFKMKVMNTYQQKNATIEAAFRYTF